MAAFLPQTLRAPVQSQAGAPANVDCLMSWFPILVVCLRTFRFRLQDAEDAAQEAIIEGYLAIQTRHVDDLDNRQAWLWRVALNAARLIARRRRRTILFDRSDLVALS